MVHRLNRAVKPGQEPESVSENLPARCLRGFPQRSAPQGEVWRGPPLHGNPTFPTCTSLSRPFPQDPGRGRAGREQKKGFFRRGGAPPGLPPAEATAFFRHTLRLGSGRPSSPSSLGEGGQRWGDTSGYVVWWEKPRRRIRTRHLTVPWRALTSAGIERYTEAVRDLRVMERTISAGCEQDGLAYRLGWDLSRRLVTRRTGS